MYLYLIEITDGEAADPRDQKWKPHCFAFAEDIDHAGVLFRALHLTSGVPHTRYVVTPQKTKGRSHREHRHLKEAFKRNLPGIGLYDLQRGWMIIPFG